MSLQTQLNSFVLRVAEEFNTVRTHWHADRADHHRQVEPGRGDQRTEGRHHHGGGHRRPDGSTTSTVFVVEDRLGARCPRPISRWRRPGLRHLAGTPASAAERPDRHRRADCRHRQAGALRCRADADRPRANAGAQQHRRGRRRRHRRHQPPTSWRSSTPPWCKT